MMVTRDRPKKHSIAAGPRDGISTAMAMQGMAQHCSANVPLLPRIALLDRRRRADSSRSSAAMAVASRTKGSRNRMTGDLRIKRFTA